MKYCFLLIIYMEFKSAFSYQFICIINKPLKLYNLIKSLTAPCGARVDILWNAILNGNVLQSSKRTFDFNDVRHLDNKHKSGNI
jgi:hypothetical protein